MSEPYKIVEDFNGTDVKSDFTPDKVEEILSGLSSTANGQYIEGPKVPLQIQMVDGNGAVQIEMDNGHRKDLSIMVTGVKLIARFASDVFNSKVKIYFGTTRENNLDCTWFSCPTVLDSLKDRHENAHHKRRILWTRTVSMRQRVIAEHVNKEISVYKRFKKPVKIKYMGEEADEFDGKRFFIAMTCYNPLEGNDNPVKFVGNLTYYYRDI